MSKVVIHVNGKHPVSDVTLETFIQVRSKRGEAAHYMVISGTIIPYTKGQFIVIDNKTYVVKDVFDSFYSSGIPTFQRLVNVKLTRY